MAFNIPGVPFKLSAQDMGGFDLGKAIQSGLQNYNTFQEARFKPKNLAEDLLAKQLQNKINQPKADYAKDITLADLAHTRAGTQGLMDEHGMRGLRQQLLQQQVNQAQYEQDLNKSLFGGGQQSNQGGMPSPGGQSEQAGESSIPSLRSNIESGMQQNAQPEPNVVNPGNPNLYHLDEIYNSDPRARQYLDKKGFKQTRTTKYDPKTGTTSVITQYPSGKIVVEANKSASTGFVPLTEKTKSTQQNIVTGIDSAVPALKKILDLDIPKQGAWNIFSPQNQATYSALSGGAIDSLVAGLGLPKIQSSTDLVKDMVHRKANESESHYKDRIRDLLTDLSLRKNRAIQTLQQGLSLKEDVPVEETKVINGKTYHKINGEWHE